MTRPPVLAFALAALFVAHEASAAELRPPLPVAALGSAGDADPTLEPGLAKTQLICAGGTALAAMPVALLAGSLVGKLSNDIVLAAVPAALVYLLLPPAASAFAARAVAQKSAILDPGYWKAFGVGVAIHLAITVAAVVLFGVSSRGYLGATLLSIVDAAAMAPGISFSMNAFATPKPAATPMPTPQTDNRPVFTLPLVAGSF